MPRATPATHAALFGSSVLLAGLAVAGKVTMREIPPGLLCFARSAGGAVLLHAAARATGRGRVRGGWRMFGRLAWFSLLGVILNQLLFLYGLHRTTATAAGILITAIPVFTVIFASLLGVEAMTAGHAAGIGLALAGVLVLLHEGWRSLAGDFLGDLMIVVNAACYALYLVLSRPTRGRLDSLTMMAWIFTFGAAALLPLGLRDLKGLDWRAVSVEAWVGLAYVVVFATALAYWLILWALHRAGPTLSAIYTYVQPVVTALLAAAWLGERITGLELAASVLVFTGVWFAAGPVPGGRRG